MWGTNSLYIINMPLFIINELHLPEKLAGIMMGTAAGLEIPTMLIAGYFAEASGQTPVDEINRCRRIFFYAGMLLAHSPAILLGLQLLNAIYIGILGGIYALFPGSDAGTSGFSHNSLYKYHSRGLDYCRIVGGIAAEIWNYHAGILVCVDDDRRHRRVSDAHQRRLRCGQRLELDEIDHGLVRRLSAHSVLGCKAGAHFWPQRRSKKFTKPM